MGTLFIVATPIGNLADMTERALATLRRVSLIAAEDTRHSGRLLAHFGISTPLISYHAFNEQSRRDRLLSALAQGDVALISDAGTPGISDPGQAIVAEAIAAGHTVSPIPGPSALTAAISASGLVDGPVTFLGFLPRESGERGRLLRRAAASGFSLALFEAPGRVSATLDDMRVALGDRQAVVFREITKLHEELRSGLLSELATFYESEAPRGECVIVVAASSEPEGSQEEPGEVVDRLIAAGLRPSEVAKEAAAITGLPRSELYMLVQEKKRTNR